ncbi:unnamed protein product [Rotaria sordida]|uniref:Uncharacterized protein n=1 Tax=Rotaria sordida TaxID=392033 RepID=A0A814T559_9BILA|nr:unnamed protein product [Rotaria sordida]
MLNPSDQFIDDFLNGSGNLHDLALFDPLDPELAILISSSLVPFDTNMETPSSLSSGIGSDSNDQESWNKIALSLIEQVLDMNSSQGLLEKENENGETPLLIAAKCNQWKLIEVILKNRSDLVEQKDKNDNNLLHLLANLNEDEGAETIGNIFKILSNDTKQILLIGKNKLSQTPLEIAQSHGNPFSCELLIENEK